MKEEIEKLLAQVNDLKCKTAKDVEEARVNLLGKKGEITKLFEEFRGYAPEMKKEFGRKLNELKQAATAKKAAPKAEPAYVNRLVKKYKEQVVPSLIKEFGYTSPMQAPKFEKIVINIGVGDATQNAKGT